MKKDLGTDTDRIDPALAEERELWERLGPAGERENETSRRAREELVQRHLGFARGMAMRYRGASESLDDLMQVASLALLKAVDRYDPERGVPFTAFATPTILGELKRHFRDRVWSVHVPRGLHDRIAQVDQTMTALTRDLQRSPSVSEIAAELGIEATEVLEVLEANRNRRAISLDRPATPGETDEQVPADLLGGEDGGFELVEDRMALNDALPELDDRERLVLRLRFVDEMTQSQIAEQIGHSQMHVSRILSRALARLRELTAGEEPA